VPIDGIAMPTNRFYNHGPQIFIGRLAMNSGTSSATSNGFGEALAQGGIQPLKR
jgi:hypothetical protein